MNSNQLKQFIVIAEEENITKAAKKLYMAPSAVSNTLKLLEEEFSLKLFDRVGNKIFLNDNGKVLLSYGSEVVSLLNTTEEKNARTVKREQNSSHIRLC